MVEGEHNSPRPRFLYDSAAIFLQNYMGIPPEQSLDGADAWAAACAAVTDARP